MGAPWELIKSIWRNDEEVAKVTNKINDKAAKKAETGARLLLLNVSWRWTTTEHTRRARLGSYVLAPISSARKLSTDMPITGNAGPSPCSGEKKRPEYVNGRWQERREERAVRRACINWRGWSARDLEAIMSGRYFRGMRRSKYQCS